MVSSPFVEYTKIRNATVPSQKKSQCNSIKTDSTQFVLRKGVRQGCPFTCYLLKYIDDQAILSISTNYRNSRRNLCSANMTHSEKDRYSSRNS